MAYFSDLKSHMGEPTFEEISVYDDTDTASDQIQEYQDK